MPTKIPKRSKCFPGTRSTRAKDKETRRARKIRLRMGKAEKPETRDIGTQTEPRKRVLIKDLVNRLLQRRRDERRARKHRARLAYREKFVELRMKVKARDRMARRAAQKARPAATLKNPLEKVYDAQVSTGVGIEAAANSGAKGGGSVEHLEAQAAAEPHVGDAEAAAASGGGDGEATELPEAQAIAESQAGDTDSDEHYSSDFAQISVEDLLEDSRYSLLFSENVQHGVYNVFPTELDHDTVVPDPGL
ncbi:unnamed protein product [Tuber aestivum]|uniref:Uncharacterized protein n=1 Tax=Tuber aestivum TaxID=59557 RepID=A0A292Q4B5_9PEZI|nr:unnamed protein product [Tuber aestivum]